MAKATYWPPIQPEWSFGKPVVYGQRRFKALWANPTAISSNAGDDGSSSGETVKPLHITADTTAYRADTTSLKADAA